MATIVLHGSLAEQFGERFELMIESAGEGLRALFCQVKGFQQAIANGNYFVEINGKESSMATFEQDAKERLPRDAEVHICPEAEGGGKWGQIIIGVIMVVVGALTSWAGGAALISAGIGMIAGGIAQLLMKPPKFDMSQSDNQSKSTSFTNLANISPQGAHVPIAYGYLEVGSVVISQSIESYDLKTASDDNGGKTEYRREYHPPFPFHQQAPANTDEVRAKNFKLVKA